jgi:hypothetical protein
VKAGIREYQMVAKEPDPGFRRGGDSSRGHRQIKKKGNFSDESPFQNQWKEI